MASLPCWRTASARSCTASPTDPPSNPRPRTPTSANGAALAAQRRSNAIDSLSMDPTATLASIAAVFHDLPDHAVEENLVIFDALLNVSDAKYRTGAAEILRNAAAASQAAARRDRLLKAAADIIAGEPCAFTPEGRSARQAAAAASTVTVDQAVERPQHFKPPQPFNPYQSDLLVGEVDSDEDEDDVADAIECGIE
jgi:hypothetical protein